METLIQELLTVARDGATDIETERVELHAVVANCWRTVATREATLVTETEQTIRADRSRLRQLLENLVRNAIEHGNADVTVVGDIDDGFYVADDGPGIPEADRTDVFDPGYSTGAEGNGLGLSIAKQVVDSHGSDVHISESDDGGTRFEITNVEFEQ